MTFTPDTTRVSLKSKDRETTSQNSVFADFALRRPSSLPAPFHDGEYLHRTTRTSIPGEHLQTVQFVSLNRFGDPAIVFHTEEDAEGFRLFRGAFDEGGDKLIEVKLDLARLASGSSHSKALEKGKMKLYHFGSRNLARECIVEEFMPKSTKLFSSSRSFEFGGRKYKWKKVDYPYPQNANDAQYFELYCAGLPDALASTRRYARQDGDVREDSHPLYISTVGQPIRNMIVSSMVVLDRLWDRSGRLGW